MPEDKTVDMKIDTGANGAVYFASDVIQTIAGIALTEVEGIANMVRYQGLAADRRKSKNANNIKKTIETMTNMRVNNVDVHVTGLSFAKENRENAEMEYRNYLLSEKNAREGKQLEGQTDPDNGSARE